MDSYFASERPPIEEADDVELLLRISYRAENPSDALAAFSSFFYRHAESLRRLCLRFRFHHPAIPAEAVVNHVMAKVYSGDVADFRPEVAVADLEVVRRQVRRWLLELARYTFYDLRKRTVSRLEVLDYDCEATSASESTVTHVAFWDDELPPPIPPERSAILALRDELTEEDRILLDRSIDYWDRVSGECRVPSRVARAIALEIGTTVAAARQRRKRMFDRMRTRLEEVLSQGEQ